VLHISILRFFAANKLPCKFVCDQRPDRADEYKDAANALVSHMSNKRINYISNQAQSWTPDKTLTEYLRELGSFFVKNLPDDKKLWFTELETELNKPLGEIKRYK